MPVYIVVYVTSATSYLAKYYSAGHYETVASGDINDLKRLANELNRTKDV